MTIAQLPSTTVETTGGGRDVVVVPGGPARDPAYLEGLGGLGRHGFRLHTIHLRGVGSAPAPADESDYAASRQAEGLEEVRTHLGLETITLVAHSAGAVVALDFAADHPDRIDRLVLITPATGGLRMVETEEEYRSQLAKHADEPWYPTAMTALDEIDRDGMTPERRAAMMPLLYGHWTDAAQAHAALDASQSNPEARRHYFRDAPDPIELRQRLGRVTCPVRIIIGERDMGPGPGLAAQVAELFDDARVLVQPGAGHFGWVDDPAGFRDLLVTVLTD